ncbi:hypothetical protein ACJMK2_024167, partial [Sinanodonta woodiana]
TFYDKTSVQINLQTELIVLDKIVIILDNSKTPQNSDVTLSRLEIRGCYEPL